MGQGQSQFTGTFVVYGISIFRFIMVKLVVFMGICHCQEAVAIGLKYKVNKKRQKSFFSHLKQSQNILINFTSFSLSSGRSGVELRESGTSLLSFKWGSVIGLTAPLNTICNPTFPNTATYHKYLCQEQLLCEHACTCMCINIASIIT